MRVSIHDSDHECIIFTGDFRLYLVYLFFIRLVLDYIAYVCLVTLVAHHQGLGKEIADKT